jgi:hypothetical protein
MAEINCCTNASCPLNGACGRFESDIPKSWFTRYWKFYVFYVPEEIGGCWRCVHYVARGIEVER